jgi:hypothetical protein
MNIALLGAAMAASLVARAEETEPKSSPAAATPAASSAPAPEASPATSSAAEPQSSPASIPAATRRVSLPAFQVLSPQDPALQGDLKLQEWPQGKTYDYATARFTVAMVLASWSQRAQDLARRLNDWQSFLATRRVNLVGLFTHDSPSDILETLKRNTIAFPVSKVDLTFVSTMLNPKVPTVWILDHTGQIVFRVERPSDEQMKDVRAKLVAWTDF